MADRRITAGIFADGGFAVLARPDARPFPGGRAGPGGQADPVGGRPGPGVRPDPGGRQPAAASVFQLSVLGYGPAGADLAAELASAVQAWAVAGRPEADGFRISAYPRAGGEPLLPGGAVIQRPHTTFVVRPA